jgi:hypothetical protein
MDITSRMRCQPRRALAAGARLLLRAAGARRALAAAHTAWVLAVLSARLLSLTRRHSCRWALFAARLLAFALLLTPSIVALGAWYASSARVARAVRYGPHRRNDADVIAPRAGAVFCVCPAAPAGPCVCDTALHPVVLLFPGGAWTIGHRLWALTTARALAAAGAVAVCVDYRNFPQASLSGMLADVDAAIECLLQRGGAGGGGGSPPSDHGGELRSAVLAAGGDLDQVFVWGHSAGAHLAVAAVIERAICDTLAVQLAAAPESLQLGALGARVADAPPPRLADDGGLGCVAVDSLPSHDGSGGPDRRGVGSGRASGLPDAPHAGAVVSAAASPSEPAALGSNGASSTSTAHARPRLWSASLLHSSPAAPTDSTARRTPRSAATPALSSAGGGRRVRLAPATPPRFNGRLSLRGAMGSSGSAGGAIEDAELDSEFGLLGRLALAATDDVAASPRGPSEPGAVSPTVGYAVAAPDGGNHLHAGGYAADGAPRSTSACDASLSAVTPAPGIRPQSLAFAACGSAAYVALPPADEREAELTEAAAHVSAITAGGTRAQGETAGTTGRGEHAGTPSPRPRQHRVRRVFGVSGPFCLEQQAQAIARKAGFAPAFFGTAFEGQPLRFSPPWWLRRCAAAHAALRADTGAAGAADAAGDAPPPPQQPAFPPLDPRCLPPFSLFHGTDDSTVPHAASIALHDALLDAAADACAPSADAASSARSSAAPTGGPASRLTLLPGASHTSGVLEDPLGGRDWLAELVLADMRADVRAAAAAEGRGGRGAAAAAAADSPPPPLPPRPAAAHRGAPPLLTPACVLRVAAWLNPF